MISVIVPVYNVAEYLHRCLESIISQSYKDLEIILVDDGSTDGSGRICDDYAEKDKRVRVIHQENLCLSEARNRGLREAIGDYIIMPDGDDVLHPRMVETLYNLINSGDFDFAMCYGKKVVSPPRDHASLLDTSHSFCIDQKYCMKGLFVDSIQNRIQFAVVWNKLYRRAILDNLKMAPISAEDVYFNSLVYQRINKAIVIPLYLYYYVQRDSSITHQGINLKWVKIPASIKLCLDSISTNNRLYRSYCLRGLSRRILSTRLWCKGTPNYSIAMNDIRCIHKQTLREYLTNTNISFIEKAVYLFFYYCPFLYRLFIAFMEFRAKRKNIYCF